MNIAMVDDNQTDLDKMKDALTEYAAAKGTEIAFDAFLSGEKPLADYRPFLYAVVFPDIFMDGMTGIEVACQHHDACHGKPSVFRLISQAVRVKIRLILTQR